MPTEYALEQTPIQVVIEEFFEAKKAERLSQHTISDYSFTFKKFTQFIGADMPFGSITSLNIRKFLNSYTEVSKKTIRNYYLGLSSLWSWAVEERYCSEHVVRKLKIPKAEQRVIYPLSKEEVTKLLESLELSKPYTRPGKRACSHSLTNYWRNRAIILFLLDLGLRASELCSLRVADIGDHTAKVFGKGSKERMLPIGERAWQALMDYWKEERDKLKLTSYVFSVDRSADSIPLDRDDLRHQIYRIAARAGVTNVHPHRFRHTFAINYLRNGGNPYSLQMALGHSSMDMVKHYLSIANSDLVKFHKIASPVDNWGL